MKTFEAVFEYRIKDDHGSRFAHACVRVEAKDDTDAERKISELLQRAVGEPEPVTVEPDPWIPLVADYVKGLEEVSFHEVVEAALVGEPPRLRLSKTWRIKPRRPSMEIGSKGTVFERARACVQAMPPSDAGHAALFDVARARGAQTEKLRDALAKIRLLTKPHGRDEIYDPSMCIGCIADGALLSLEKA